MYWGILVITRKLSITCTGMISCLVLPLLHSVTAGEQLLQGECEAYDEMKEIEDMLSLLEEGGHTCTGRGRRCFSMWGHGFYNN